MNLFRLSCLVSLLSVAPSALAAECGQPISVDSVAKLSGTITLGGLTAKFGEWCQGHGPVSYYKDTDGNEIWFFWKATSQSVTTDEDRMKFQVLTASIVSANAPGEYKIIWPKKFVGKDIEGILAKEYASK